MIFTFVEVFVASMLSLYQINNYASIFHTEGLKLDGILAWVRLKKFSQALRVFAQTVTAAGVFFSKSTQ